MNKDNTNVINTFKPYSMFNRFVSSVVDAALFGIIAFGLLIGSSFIFAKLDTPISRNNTLQTEHIRSTHLSTYSEERGYQLFEQQEYFTIENDSYKLLNSIFYYYTSYLTGENIVEGEKCSLNYNVKDSEGRLPKDIFTIAYVNEHVLQAGEDKGFFLYQNVEGEVRKDLKAQINPVYIEEVKAGETIKKQVKYDTNLYSFCDSFYNNSVNHFYNLDFINKSSITLYLYNSFIIFFSGLIGLIVSYLIIPLTNEYGITLGKRIMGFILVDDRGFKSKKYKLFLRTIPLFAGIILVSFASNLFIEIVGCVILFLVSISLMIFTHNKQALHDFIARTIVVNRDEAMIFENKDHYLAYKKVIEAKDQEKDGKQN